MGESLALIPVEKDNVTGFGLSLAQAKTQPDPINLVSVLAAFQRVTGPTKTEPPFLRSTLES